MKFWGLNLIEGWARWSLLAINNISIVLHKNQCSCYCSTLFSVFLKHELGCAGAREGQMVKGFGFLGRDPAQHAAAPEQWFWGCCSPVPGTGVQSLLRSEAWTTRMHRRRRGREGKRLMSSCLVWFFHRHQWDDRDARLWDKPAVVAAGALQPGLLLYLLFHGQLSLRHSHLLHLHPRPVSKLCTELTWGLCMPQVKAGRFEWLQHSRQRVTIFK